MQTPMSEFPAQFFDGDSAGVPDYMQALDGAAAYLTRPERETLLRAWRVGAAAHAGQTRKSGEPYITHPVAVAMILAELGLDIETLVAAILHDTIEDTPVTRAEIAGQFGESVAEIVEGLTKLDKLKFRDRQEAAAESFRKMMLAMSRDLRVILIKLADRLHNMRTLGAQSSEARTRIARETLEIYAPIAQRLGMNLMKAELQDLGFRALHPWRYAAISEHIRQQPVVRREAMVQVEARLAHRLASEGLAHTLVGRVKSPFSIYTKMRAEQKTVEQVLDVFGFRIIVDSVRDCYYALGLVHSVFKPLEGRFRDFVAIPKANGYQSLHTVLFGPYGAPIEVQIRTRDMDTVAERGVAAHWSYKLGGETSTPLNRANAWISSMVESERTSGSSLEFLENVKVDLYPDEVYVFTPKGKILSLPRNATALDFAYVVHTDVGNQAVTSRVDGKLAPLRTKLSSGQTVEIVTAKSAAPSTQWLEFVVTAKARSAIRQQLKQLEHEDAVRLGHRMIERAFQSIGIGFDKVSEERLSRWLTENRYPRLEALLEDVALGRRVASRVAGELLADEARVADRSRRGSPQEALAALAADHITLNGSEGGVVAFAQCCMPIPGDGIMGYQSAERGIVVHQLSCANVPEFMRHPERCVSMAWDENVSGEYATRIIVVSDNKPGVLAQIASVIAQGDSNISNVDYLERDARTATIRFVVEVKDTNHLADLIRRMRRLETVHQAARE